MMPDPEKVPSCLRECYFEFSSTIYVSCISAVFYPDGKLPISGMAVKQPDGTYKFVAYNPVAISPGTPPLLGLLKITPEAGEKPVEARGVMSPTDTPGIGIFSEGNAGEPGE